MYDVADIPPHEMARTVRFHDHHPGEESFREALHAGLSQPAKSIPCRFLYDARGSVLFDQICELPEYYPTRTETQILRDRAGEIAALIGAGAELVELGTQLEIIQKSGSWYSYKDSRLGQGAENVKKLFNDNPELADEVEGLIRERLGLKVAVEV